MSRYASLSQLKEFVQIVDTVDDSVMEVALSAAEDQIDEWCRRRFDQAHAEDTTERFYDVGGVYLLPIDDVVEVTDVEVRRIRGGDYSTVDQFELGPLNAAADGKPSTELETVQILRGRVKVVGRFGWPAIPDQVVQATLLQASRLAQRRNAQFGIATVPGLDGSGMRLLSKLDADVELLLAPLRRRPVLV